jgi:hypothetical protein
MKDYPWKRSVIARAATLSVMAGLDPAIHVFAKAR